MSTKFLKAFVVLTTVMFLASACGMLPVMGSGRLISESRSVSGYDQVAVSGGGDLVIIQDGTEGLSIKTDDNLMQYVVSEVKGKTLNLYWDNRELRSFNPTHLEFTLHVKDLTGITTSGSWTVTSAAIKAGNLDIGISGWGKVRIDNLTVDRLTTTVSGSGQLNLAGKANDQTITVSGSGKYLAGDLQSQTSQIRISGSGNATLWAEQTLDVYISGSGNVGYYGNPQVQFSQSGSGKIQNLGTK